MTLSSLKGVIGDESPPVLCRDEGGGSVASIVAVAAEGRKSGSESAVTLRPAQESALVQTPLSAALSGGISAS